jgi:hypothetical protein
LAVADEEQAFGAVAGEFAAEAGGEQVEVLDFVDQDGGPVGIGWLLGDGVEGDGE